MGHEVDSSSVDPKADRIASGVLQGYRCYCGRVIQTLFMLELEELELSGG